VVKLLGRCLECDLADSPLADLEIMVDCNNGVFGFDVLVAGVDNDEVEAPD
jgi:hypothetical protein